MWPFCVLSLFRQSIPSRYLIPMAVCPGGPLEGSHHRELGRRGDDKRRRELDQRADAADISWR